MVSPNVFHCTCLLQKSFFQSSVHVGSTVPLSDQEQKMALPFLERGSCRNLYLSRKPSIARQGPSWFKFFVKSCSTKMGTEKTAYVLLGSSISTDLEISTDILLDFLLFADLELVLGFCSISLIANETSRGSAGLLWGIWLSIVGS